MHLWRQWKWWCHLGIMSPERPRESAPHSSQPAPLQIQLSGEPLPKHCDGRNANSSGLPAKEDASKGDQSTAGKSVEVQEHAASSSTATAFLTKAKLAGASSAASLRSDAALQKRKVAGSSCSYDAAKDTDAASSPCQSSAGSFLSDTGCAEREQSQAPHVHGPSRAGHLSSATGDPSPPDTSLSESTHAHKSDIMASQGSPRNQLLQQDDASSAANGPARDLSDRGSRPQPNSTQHGQHARGEQHTGSFSSSRANFAEGAAAHQEVPASSGTPSRTWQTGNVEGVTTEPLLEPLLHNSRECPRIESASGSSGSACDIRQGHECSLKRRVRDPGQAQATGQSHEEGQKAGDGVRQQQRQTDVTLDLAIAVSMVVGLTAVLACGLFMLAATYMSAHM